MGFILDPKPVTQGIGLAALIANIVVPGLGTLVYGLAADDIGVLRMVLQFIGAVVFIGWLSAVIDGVKILMAADQPPATRAA